MQLNYLAKWYGSLYLLSYPLADDKLNIIHNVLNDCA